MTKYKRVAVLVSGSGTLLEALIEAGVPIACVVADRHCRGIDEVAKEAGISQLMVPRKAYRESGKFDRQAYTRATIKLLKSQAIDLIVMAGWMTIFSEEMFAPEAFGGQITNNHPSLLPAFKGEQAVQDALDAGVKVTGCTIHIATPELDAGPILAQQAVPVEPGDDVDSLWERIKQAERPMLVRVVNELLGSY